MKLRLFYFAPPENVATARWLSAFVRLGHEVHLGTTNTTAGKAIPGVVVHDINVNGAIPRGVRFIPRWIKVNRILREVRPDVVHGHMISWSGGYAAYFLRRPLVMTPWGSDILVSPQRSRLRWWETRWRLSRCDLITVSSENLKRAVSTFGIPEDRIALVRWGVNVERIQSFRGHSHLRELANVPRDAFLVLATRWFEPIYNVETVLHAVPKVLSGTERSVCFVFLGGGSLEAQLKSQAIDLGVEKYVRFMGCLPHEELEECYGGADAYVSVPHSDGAPVTLLEAMAAGLPVVVNDLPANLEEIRDGWNGYVVSRSDSGAIAAAILRLIENKGRCQEFGERNMKIAKEKADHMTHMRKMEKIYEQLVQSRQRL